MARRLVVSVLLLLAASAAVRAAEPVRLDGLAVPEWTVAEGPKTWVGGAVEEKIDGFVVFHQGFNLTNSQWLLLKRGDAALDVYVFTYDTPANAYGLYTVMRRTIMQAGGAESVPVGDEASFHPMGQLVAWVGRSAVIVSTATAKAPEKEAFLAVAGKLAAQGQGSSPKPELVSKLPADGLDAGSVIYCHYRQALDQVFYAGEENVLGLGDDVKTPTEVEAAHARYALDDRPHALIAIRYPDEAAAAKAAAAFAATLKDEARSEDSQGFWRDFGLRNGKHTIIYQSGKLLAISPEAVAVDKVKDLIRALAAAVIPPPEPATGGG